MPKLRDFCEFQKLLGRPLWSTEGKAFWIVTKDAGRWSQHLYDCLDLSARCLDSYSMNAEHELCTMTDNGLFKPVAQLFVPFDKERAPLNNNLLVYINGQILWDNVRLAQQSKES